MARIPEGTFRTEPSSRVGGGTVSLEKPDTKSLRKLGKEFSSAATQLDAAQLRADQLDKAASLEDMYNKDIESAKANIELESRNGKIKPSGSLGNVKEPATITNEFSRVANAFHQKATATLGEGDHIARQMYTKYVLSKVENDQNNMAVLQSKQIYDFHLDTMKKSRNTVMELWKSGKDIASAYAQYMDKLELSIPVLGHAGVAEQALALDNLLGLKASEHVALNSPTPHAQKQAVKEAEERINKLSDEGLKIASKRQLKETIAAVESSRFKAKKEGEAKVATYADDPQDLIENKDTVMSLLKSNIAEPRGKHETADDRAESIGLLGGKLLGASVALSEPKANLDDITNAIDREIDSWLTDNKDNAQVTDVGEDNVRSRMTKHAREYVSSYRDKLNTDSGGQYASRDGNYRNRLYSGVPQQQTMAVNQSKEYAKKSGLASEDWKMIPIEDIDSFVKQFGESADLDGNEAASLINNFNSRLGENGPQAMKELYARDRGKTVPASAAFAVRVSDKTMQIEIMRDAAMYGNNLQSLKESGVVDDPKKFRADIISDTHEDISGLRFGRAGENIHISEAFKEALVHRTAAILARPNADTDVGDAYKRALSDIQKELKVSNSSKGTLLVDKNFLSKFQPQEYELTGMGNSLGKMKYLDKANVEINWPMIIEMAKKDSALETFADVARRAMKKSPAEANELFASEIGPDLRIKSDSVKPNTANIMLQPTNRDMVPIPMKVPYPVTEEGRKVIQNPDGSKSTERTETIKIGRKFFNVPTIYDGKSVSVDEAKKIIKGNGFVDPDTGRVLEPFDDADTAVKKAQLRSAALGREILLGESSNSQINLVEYFKSKKAFLTYSGSQAESKAESIADDRSQAAAAFARQSPVFKHAMEKDKKFQALKKRDAEFFKKLDEEDTAKTRAESKAKMDELENFWKNKLKGLEQFKR